MECETKHRTLNYTIIGPIKYHPTSETARSLILPALVGIMVLALVGCNIGDDNGNDNTKNAVAPCPSIAKLGEAYQNPCQLELDFELEIVRTESRENDDRYYKGESVLATSGELNQLYPPPFFLEENLAFLEFSGDVSSVGSCSGSPAYYPEPRPTGWRESTYESQADFAGPVTLLVVEQFEPHPDDSSRYCLTIGMEATMTGNGITISTLPDGTTREKEIGPMTRWFSQPEGREEWVMGRATNATSSLPPSQTIVCEGAPPADGQDERIVECSRGGCQVEFFGRLGAMAWYGLTADEEHNRWTFSGDISVSDLDIIGVNDTEYTWHLNIDLATVPQTLEYE